MKLFLRDEVFANGRMELLSFFQAANDQRDFVELDETGPYYQQWFADRGLVDREDIQAAIAMSFHST